MSPAEKMLLAVKEEVDCWHKKNRVAREEDSNDHMWKILQIFFEASTMSRGTGVLCEVCNVPEYDCICASKASEENTRQLKALIAEAQQIKLHPLNSLARNIAANVKSRGFKTPTDLRDHEAILAKLMLVVSELSEAVEEVRKPEQSRKAFDEEICDVFIRLFDICGAMEIDIDGGIAAKELKNSQRKFLHGKVC